MKILDEAYLSDLKICENIQDRQYFKSLSGEMKSDAGKATRIQIVSGYFSKDYALELLTQVPTKRDRSKCSVNLIFGCDATADLVYFETQISDLKNSIIDLGFKEKNLHIDIFRKDVPLHTKLYGFLKSTKPVWYVGSANFSTSIEGDRHELMMRITGKVGAFDAYIRALQAYNNKKAVVQVQGSIEAARFLSEGLILFHPSRHSRFTYDEFLISAADRKVISKRIGKDSRVPHSDPSAQGFGFDLLDAIGMKNIEQKERHIPKVSIKPYCVETAYGYWVPLEYKSEIELKFKERRILEQNKYQKIREALTTKTESELISEFKIYYGATKKLFAEIGINPRPQRDILFKDFLKTRRTWLENDSWIEKASMQYKLNKMPDIWSDTRAAKLFITSFCDDVCWMLNTTGNKPKVYRRINDVLQLPKNPTADDVMSRFNFAKDLFSDR